METAIEKDKEELVLYTRPRPHPEPLEFGRLYRIIKELASRNSHEFIFEQVRSANQTERKETIYMFCDVVDGWNFSSGESAEVLAQVTSRYESEVVPRRLAVAGSR
jgi:hypothetical protein